MNVLALLPLFGLLGGLLATGGQAMAMRTGQGRWDLAHRVGVGVAVAGTVSTFATLLVLFLAGQVQYQYVFLYTRTDLGLGFKVAGTWAGREGSLVLWTLYLTLILAWLVRRDGRCESDTMEQRARAWTRLWFAGILTAFLAAVWVQDLFVATPEFFLQSRPQGNGLNPTLVSPFMLIHPPIMFLAYALTTVPAAVVLAHLSSGTDRWSTISLSPSRLNWLLYTLAMGLGGIWAYYTLGFGGYWAWDPVEVANLLPWLALTVFLHAQLHHLKHGRYRSVGPFLGLLPLLLTLFSTISTRSGLWVSVHAFTDPTQTFNPDAPGRFLDILAVEEGLRFYVALWLALLLIGLALWSRRLALDTGKLPRVARVTAGVLGAFGVLSLLSPGTSLSILFELANTMGQGRAGLGLLGITAIAILGAAAPALASDDEDPNPRRRGLKRLDLQGLAYASILILGLGLLVIFLFHIAAANGWSEAFYTARFPWLATPVTIGLLLFVTYPVHGRRRAVQIAIVVLMLASLAATVFPAHREGAYVLGLTVPALLFAADRVRRLALAPKTPRPLVWARSMLWIAALLAVVFWINPPSRVGLGPLSWHPVWPAQLFFGAAAFYGLHRAQKHMTASDPSPGRTHLLVGALAGFGVGAVLAAIAWGLERKNRSRKPNPKNPERQLRQVALLGAHTVVLLVLVGYATTTYFGSEQQVVLELGESAEVGTETLTFTGIRTEQEGPFVASLHPQVQVRGLGTGEGTLYWEGQSASHFPLPATVRAWNRDVYFAVDGICLSANCTAASDFVRAYEPSGRVFAGETEATQVQLQVFTLPGLSLVWASLLLFVYWMGLLMATPEPPAQRLSPSSSSVNP